jgi:hypothetical protein
MIFKSGRMTCLHETEKAFSAGVFPEFSTPPSREKKGRLL